MFEVSMDDHCQKHKASGVVNGLFDVGQAIHGRGVSMEDAMISIDVNNKTNLTFTNAGRKVVVLATFESVYRCEIDGRCVWSVCPHSCRHHMENEIVRVLSGNAS